MLGLQSLAGVLPGLAAWANAKITYGLSLMLPNEKSPEANRGTPRSKSPQKPPVMHPGGGGKEPDQAWVGGPFADRSEAGRVLAQALELALAGRPRAGRPLVLALPRGGVPVAAEIAQHLEAELDVVMVRKIGAPSHPEVAMGAMAAVGGTFELVKNPRVLAELSDPDRAFAEVTARERIELDRRERMYRAGRMPVEVGGRTVLIVDDGAATGATMRAALAATRRLGPEQLVAAVPVSLGGAVGDLAEAADAVVCPWTAGELQAVGQAYRQFGQVSDAEVQQILARP
jgi:putative phosphoribosyl transferase